MSLNTLQMTNGDAALSLLKKAGVLGTHLAWRDVLHEGPVPAGLALEAQSAVRADYLASRGFGNAIKLRHDLAKRDAVVRRARDFEEIVLWFEHDLYDQLQILQILTQLRADGIEAGRVSLVQTDVYLTALTIAELDALYPKRRTVTESSFAYARRAWDAFVSDDPMALLPFAREDAPQLPHLRAGFARLCEEYPWMHDGLSRSQRAALAAVSTGPARSDELFRRAQAREEAPFLGDASFAAIVRDLASGPAPLLEGEEDALVPSVLGRRVLAGDADWLAFAPCDRWIGGVHLTGSAPVRWDELLRTFNARESAVQ